MNEKTSTIKKFGIPAAVIVVVGLLLYVMFGSKANKTPEQGISSGGLSSTVTEQPITTVSNQSDTSTDKTGDTIVNLLSSVSTLSLPDDILRNENFLKLSETSVELPPRNDPGRRNPFSELSGSGTAKSINPNSADLFPQTQTSSSDLLDVKNEVPKQTTSQNQIKKQN